MDYIDNNFDLFNMLINYNPEARITFENLNNETMKKENYPKSSKDPENNDINSYTTSFEPTLNECLNNTLQSSMSKKSENNMQLSNDVILHNNFLCNLRENITFNSFEKMLTECSDTMNSTPNKFSKKRSISESEETTLETSSFNLHEKFSFQVFERLLNSFDDNQDIASNNTRENNLETNNSQMIQNTMPYFSTTINQTGGSLDNNDTNYLANQQGSGQNDVIIIQESSHFNKKFQVSQDTYGLKFDTNDNNFVDFNTQLDKLFDKVYNFIKSKVKNDKNKVRVVFFHPVLQKPISTPFITFSDFNKNLIIQVVSDVAQSKRSLTLDDLSMMLQTVNIPSGSQYFYDKLQYKLLNQKKGIIINLSQDNFCLIHAILIAKNHHDFQQLSTGDQNKMRKKNHRYKNINNKSRYKEVNKIVKALKFENMQSLDISDIKKLEVYFKEYKINCVDDSGNSIYKDSYIEKP